MSTTTLSEAAQQNERNSGPSDLVLGRRLFVCIGISAILGGCKKPSNQPTATVTHWTPSDSIKFPNERPQPTYWSYSEETEKFLRQHFEVVCGNASIENAKIIGLPDIHFFAGMEGFRKRKLSQKILKDHGKEGDLLLEEAFGPDEAVPDDHPLGSFGYMPHNFVRKGWDDMNAWQEGKDDLDKILSMDGKLRESEIIACQLLCKGDKLLLDRNDSMIKVVNENKDNFRKVWIYSGSGHYVKDARLDTSFGDTPFIIFAFKGDTEDTIKNGRNFESRMRELGIEINCKY